jgi:WD40 repeat protein
MAAIFISHSSKDTADADVMATWLIKQGHTSYFIDNDEKSGISAGTRWEQVLYQRLRQCQAIVALVTPDWLESKWCFAEMTQAREKGKPIFPVITKPCQPPGLLSDIQQIDLTADLEGGYRRLALGLKQIGLDPTDVFDWDPMRPPYPGLPSFEEDDAAVFFGRGPDILEARERLEGLRRHNQDVPRLLLVLGPSGSGKSSLVRAGLIPRLKKAKENWLPLRPFRPQDESNPLDALAFAFADTYKGLGLPCNSDLVRARLSRAAAFPVAGSAELLSIARELACAAGHRDATVLITVDQAEELFGSVPLEIGKTFLQFLGASLSAGDRHLMAVGTLRSDFLGIFQDQVSLLDPAYRRGLSHLPIPVQPIPVERYADLIEGPANRDGIVLEGGLVQKLLRDAGQHDSLPLLAFILRRIYDLRFEGPHAATLTIHDYEKLGSLAGAVQNAADRIINEPKPAEDEIAALREAFIPGLVRTNEEGSYSRRRAFIDKLPLKARGLLKRFINARLLVAGEDGWATVEIAHEALLRTWPTLDHWLQEDREKLRQHNAIVRAAQEWNQHRREDAYLVHRDGRLEDAKKLVAERRFTFAQGSVERDYLDTSIENQQVREAAAQEEHERRLTDAEQLARAQAERAEEAEKREKEQKEAASKLRRRAWILAMVTFAAIVASGLAVLGLNSALTQAKAALSREFAARSLLAAESNPAEALVLGVEAGRLGNDLASSAALRKALKASHLHAVLRHDNAITDVAFTENGQQVVSVGRDNQLRIWEAQSAKLLTSIKIQESDGESGLYQIVISPDGTHMAARGNLNHVYVWDLASRKQIFTFETTGASTMHLAFSHDSSRLLTVHGATVEVRSTDDWRKLLEVNATVLVHGTFSPDDRFIAAASSDGYNVLFFDAHTGERQANLQTGGTTIAAEFSPDGKWLVATSKAAGLKLWNVEDPRKPIFVGEAFATNVTIQCARFHQGPEPLRLVVCRPDGVVKVLEQEGKWSERGLLSGHQRSVLDAAFDSTGDRLALAGEDGTARIWVRNPGDILTAPSWSLLCVLRGHQDKVFRTKFSPDGRWVVTLSMDGTAMLWRPEADQEVATFGPLWSEIKQVAADTDGRQVVALPENQPPMVWSLSTRKCISLGEHGLFASPSYRAVTFSPDGKSVLAAGPKNQATLYDAASGVVQRAFRGHEDSVVSAEFDKTGKRIVTASDDHTFRIWDVPSGDSLVVIQGPEQSTWGASFSPDGRRIISIGWDGMARIWSDAGRLLATLDQGSDSKVYGARFSSDGRRLITTGGGSARIWDSENWHGLGTLKPSVVKDGCRVDCPDERHVVFSQDGLLEVVSVDNDRHRTVLRGQGVQVESLAASADGSLLLTSDHAGIVSLWDAKTGSLLTDIHDHSLLHNYSGAIVHTTFSADGRVFATGGQDGTVRVYYARNRDLVELARSRLPVHFKAQEREEMWSAR